MTRLLAVLFVIVSSISSALAATYADGAKEIQERLQRRAEQVCSDAKESAMCHAEFRTAQKVAATVQVRYVDIIRAMTEGNAMAAAEARWDVRATYDLLVREWTRLIGVYK